jgi:serine/threonine-protein kinase
MIGRRVGSWVIERELGRGGMGAVYEAHHATLRTHAAVKVLSAGLESEDAFRQRFRREAELQAQLRHPNVARVLDYIEDGGQWFLVVEYLERGSIADWMSAHGKRTSSQQSVDWIRQALAGLGHAHQKGIVHRDIKPANLLLNENGEVVVADFGIARAESAPALTATDHVIGTPHYMSPEQIITPNRVDGRGDIYSLGVVFYELLTGRKPFDGGSQFAVLQAQINEPPPPLRAADLHVSSDLEAVILRALAKKPAERYATCDAMSQAITATTGIRALERTMTVLPPAVSGGTVVPSALYEKALVSTSGAKSPAAIREGKRRAFRTRLAAFTAIVLLAAVLLAHYVSSNKVPDGTPAVFQPMIGTKTTETEGTDGKQPPAPNPGDGKTTMGMVVDPDSARPNKTTDRPQPGLGHGVPIVPSPGRPRTPVPSIPPTLNPAPVTPSTPQTQPTAMPLPERPQIAVIGGGNDPLLAGALEQEMEGRLSGYNVVDEHADPAIDNLLSRHDTQLSSEKLGKALVKDGFHILVLVRVEQAEKRTFSLGGIDGSAKAARLRMNAYLLPADRPIGPGWTELVEYTELSAATKARQAFIGPTADLRKAIDDAWRQLGTASRSLTNP